MQIGKIISAIREEKGLKQNFIAEKSGITQNYLSQIEHDKKVPNLEVLKNICNALETPIYVVMFKALNESNLINSGKKEKYKAILDTLESAFEVLS